MAFPLLGLLIGAAVGAGKHFAVDKPAADRQRKLAAETQRYSPWTGLRAGPVEDPNVFGSMLTFGGSGAALEQGAQRADDEKALMEKIGNYYALGGPNAVGNKYSWNWGGDNLKGSSFGGDYAASLGGTRPPSPWRL